MRLNPYHKEEGLRDSNRDHRGKVLELIGSREIKTSVDYFNAALIFHHGDRIAHYIRAKQLAKKAIKLGNQDAKWIYAAITDRILVAKGKKQRFGTQYHVNITHQPNGALKAEKEIHPYDKRISDLTRAKFNVPPIEKLLSVQQTYGARLRLGKAIRALG